MKKLIFIAFLAMPFLASAQNKIEEFVLKDGRTAILYDNGLWIYKESDATKRDATKSTSINSLTSPNKAPNSKSSISTTRSTSSTCGAPTKKGGSCRRIVSGGGRCWQH